MKEQFKDNKDKINEKKTSADELIDESSQYIEDDNELQYDGNDYELRYEDNYEDDELEQDNQNELQRDTELEYNAKLQQDKLQRKNKLRRERILKKEKLSVEMQKEIELIYKHRNFICPINNPNSESTKFYKENEEQFNWYLSGLFCGSGNLDWTLDKKYGRKYPKISITLQQKEVTTLFWLKDIFPDFTEPKPIAYRRAWRMRGNRRELIKDIYIRLNGKVFLPIRVKQMKKLAEYFNIPFIECDMSKIDFTENAFLSGFFDAEGNWYYERHKDRIIWHITQRNEEVFNYMRNSFTRKRLTHITRKVGFISKKFVKVGTVCKRHITSHWYILNNEFGDYTEIIKYLEKFPLKTYKAFCIERYKLFEQHVKYKTYESKKESVKSIFQSLVLNFDDESTFLLYLGDKAQNDFLKKHQVLKIRVKSE